MSFVGNTNHGDLPVRERMAQQCLAYKDDAVCTMAAPKDADSIASLKMRSRFCLESVRRDQGPSSLSMRIHSVPSHRLETWLPFIVLAARDCNNKLSISVKLRDSITFITCDS